MNELTTPADRVQMHEDAWIASSCALCYGSCSILAHRVGGTVVKIEGNPQSVVAKGRLCAKGVSGIMTHYDPNRLTKPLRRTNPKKGLDEDPHWKEIGWDEALDEIAAVLKRVRADDPRKLLVQRTTTVTASRIPLAAFATGFGTPNASTAGGGLHCGNGTHLLSGTMHASWGIVPDFEYCNYAIYFGASKGHGAGHASASNMGLAAQARVRGMKLVVVDPRGNGAAAKADEWLPVRPGTDGAMFLAMMNVLVNEVNIYDAVSRHQIDRTEDELLHDLCEDTRRLTKKKIEKSVLNPSYSDESLESFGNFYSDLKKSTPAKGSYSEQDSAKQHTVNDLMYKPSGRLQKILYDMKNILRRKERVVAVATLVAMSIPLLFVFLKSFNQTPMAFAAITPDNFELAILISVLSSPLWASSEPNGFTPIEFSVFPV